jgi:hypothetical protein
LTLQGNEGTHLNSMSLFFSTKITVALQSPPPPPPTANIGLFRVTV